MNISDRWRNPRTKNEMTQYFSSITNEVDIPVCVRGSRRPKHLPNSWDEIDRSDIRSRNWKTYRKHQWKE